MRQNAVMEKTAVKPETPPVVNGGKVCRSCFHFDPTNPRNMLCRAHPPVPLGSVIYVQPPMGGEPQPAIMWDSYQPKIMAPDTYWCHEWKHSVDGP